jgi:hypothetical protein
MAPRGQDIGKRNAPSAEAFGFPTAVDAVQVGGDAGTVAADALSGGRASGQQPLGAAERARDRTLQP